MGLHHHRQKALYDRAGSYAVDVGYGMASLSSSSSGKITKAASILAGAIQGSKPNK